MSKKSSYVGKYVCFGLSDGSFSWGRIKHEGTVNTPNGYKEVFVLTDRMTCYVPKGELAQNSVRAIGRRISAGTAGPMVLPEHIGSDSLPDYQKAGYGTKALPKKTVPDEKPKGKNKNVPAKQGSMSPAVPESQGVPELSSIMNIEPSPGLRMFQKAGSVQSSVDPNKKIDYIFRKYGYDTNVRKDQLNLDEVGGDIIDRNAMGLKDLTDDELFLLVMKRKISGIGLSQGVQNMLHLGMSPVPECEIEDKAVSLLKERKGIKPK